MSNRVTLAQFAEMTREAALAVPVDQIEMLLEDVAELQDKAKRAASTMHSYMGMRFGNDFAKVRKTGGKDTGTINIVVAGRTIKSDLPKKIDWSQEVVKAALLTIKNEWKGNPDEYVDVKYSISETKWNAWPEPIKALFRDARTVGVGKETFEIKSQKGA